MWNTSRYCKPPKTTDIVLIGGEHDKKVISIDDSDNTYIRMQIMDTKTGEDDSQVYRIEHLRGRYKYVKVGIYRGITVDEAIEMLVESYKEGER